MKPGDGPGRQSSVADLSGAQFSDAGRELPSATNIDFTNPNGPQVTLGGASGEINLRNFLTSDRAMKLLWKNEADRSEKLIFEFAQRGVPEQTIRWTGWAGKIGDHVHDLPVVVDAFQGVKGFHMFGGTQVLDLETAKVKPNICDVAVALKRNDPDLILIGVIPKVSEEPKYIQDIGLIVSVRDHSAPDKKDGHFTRINPDQNIGIVLQPDVNGVFNWSDEARESLRLSQNLTKKSWKTNLVVFGGSVSDKPFQLSTVEQEVVDWANAAKMDPKNQTKIILIKGSGGVADKFASDEKWLAENPAVLVVELNKDSIRDAIRKINLVTDW